MKHEIVAKSFTYAMKGKKLLEKKGLSAEIVKKASECGCQYVIRYTAPDGFDAVSFLKDGGVKIKDN